MEADATRDKLPAAVLPLSAEGVAVWQADLDRLNDDLLAQMLALLARDELDRANRFFFEEDRNRYVFGRGILRTLLGTYLARAPRDLVFAYGPKGKPALATANDEAPPVFFNVAHSEERALFAFSKTGDVGVDVEQIRDLPDIEEVAASAFSPSELQLLKDCPADRKQAEFFRAWVRQEAILKALGAGLGDAREEHGFAVYPLAVGPEFAAALAVSPRAARPERIFDWNETHDGNRTGTKLNFASL
ncbi:MAG: 4'-phosphopantetheinyl transferase superfamily protein [Verrucomicrobiota bacterium]